MKVLIADDHTILRKGIKLILLEEFPFANITEVCDAVDMMKTIMKEKFDLVISDISMPPGESGLETLEKIKADYPGTPVIILSMHSVKDYAVRAFKAGASAYLWKNGISTELVTAVKQVMSGKKYISQEVADVMADAFGSNETGRSIDQLSNRELEVFKLIASGNSNAEIARQMGLSINTINSFRSRIFDKMKFQNHLELIKYAVENKLV